VRGGADRFCSELNRLILGKGERIITFTYKSGSGAPIDSTNPNCVHYFINKELDPTGIPRKISALIGVFYAPGILKDLEKIIEKEKPVIAHIHNIYHRIPYGIIDVLNKHGIKIIWWLHDYKWICPNHQLYTQGSICKRCIGKNYFNAIKYRCQIHSLLKSTIACFFAYFVSLKKYCNKIDRFIAPSQCAYSQFKEFNFPVSNIKVQPHFNYGTVKLSSGKASTDNSGKPYALYVGRIEENKGLAHLVHAFGGSGYQLKIVGTGNYEINVKKICRDKNFSTVEFVGYVPPGDLSGYYYNSLFVVVPSVWYEVFGLAIVESFNYAKPVVAADIGAIPEIVENDKSGLLYRSGDAEDLKEKIRWMFEHPHPARQMGLYARDYAQYRFSPENYWNELNTLHVSLINKK
jgi:glycosyltransferase involved in cell wall biosynthesis